MLKKLFILFLSVPVLSFAQESYYPSGLLKSFTEEERVGEPTNGHRATQQFLEKFFSNAGRGLEWQERDKISDATHVHHYYELFYRGRRVVDQRLKIHYHRDGWVQYATSGWETPFSFDRLPEDTEAKRIHIEAQIREGLIQKFGRFRGKIEAEPVIWIDEETHRAIPAFDAKVWGEDPMVFKEVILEESSEKEIARKRIIRGTADPTSKVFNISPLRESNTSSSVTIPNLSEPKNVLSSSFFTVQREQNTSSPERVVVDPSGDYTVSPFDPSADPPNTKYKYDCNGSSCPNQQFDAVNVYYHLDNYRQRVKGYFSDLQVSPSFTSDPLPVTINVLDRDLDDDGVNDIAATNNAFVITLLFQDGHTERQMMFLRPANDSLIPDCRNTDYLDVAREAVVMVHEYQHYITDTIAKLVSSILTKPNVGDALHEGYSDYFGASHISTLNNANVSKIGEYAWQHCTPLQRDVSVPRVYDDASNFSQQFDSKGNTVTKIDYYLASLSWSSGLWILRNEVGKNSSGKQIVDLIALKSLFFLSTKPSFYEAVESLVKADNALYSGAHVTRIRQIFYDQLKFLGAQNTAFRDPANRVVEMGFQSCSAVHLGTSSTGVPLALFGFWVGFTWLLGRRRRG